MPVSRGHRLKKAAAKAVKRKAAVAEKLARDRRELRIAKPRHVDLAASPLVACSLKWDGEPAATLVVARRLSLGRYAVAEFLIDFWCLGVRDVFFQVEEEEDFQAASEDMEREGGFAPIAPGQARKLLRDAAAYGAANGFAPLEDFAETARLLSDFPPEGEDFVFGDHGRPHYLVSENEPRRQIEYVLATLEHTLGPSGFDVTYPLEDAGAQEPPG